MNVVVLTCDKYLPSLRPFSFLFNRYWSEARKWDDDWLPEPVHVVGFSHPEFNLPKNFEFISVGKDEDYPVEKWSDALIDALEGPLSHMSQFTLLLEDFWLVRQVDYGALHELWDYMLAHDDIIKVDIVRDRMFAGGNRDIGYLGCLDLVESDPDSQYQVSLQAGFWNREKLLAILERGETPWEFELQGTSRLAAKPEWRVIGSKQCPVWYDLVHKGGDPTEIYLDRMARSDRTELEKIGFIRTV